MHRNNFDFLRLLFASMVVFTHCFAVTGMGEIDTLSEITNNQLVFSFIGLSGFFTISGYLIFESLIRSKNLAEYFFKRILRIYPGLIVLMLVTFIVGGIVSIVPIKDYLTTYKSYAYIFSQLSLFRSFQQKIAGVFERNPASGMINASLWTIAYEFSFYIILALLFFIKKKPQIIKTLLMIIWILLFIAYKHMLSNKVFWEIPHTVIDGKFLVYYGLFFCAGSLMAAFMIKRIRHKAWIALTMAVLCIVTIRLNHFNLAKILLLPPIFILFGLMATKGISGLTYKVGDLSYGVYIYGFLIQQTILNYLPVNYWQLFICTMPIAIICGFLSWHLIEKRALALKYN